MDPECQDSHHTAGLKKKKHLYRTTAAGVSCERAVRDSFVKKCCVNTGHLHFPCTDGGSKLLFEALVLGATLHAVADKASGARPRDTSDCANFNEQIKKVSWLDKASGAISSRRL